MGPTPATAQDPDDGRLLVFVHIPKTAGTTLKALLAHRFPAGATHEIMMRGMSLIAPRHVIDRRPLISFSTVYRLKAALAAERGPRLIHGHLDLSLERWLPAGARFLTMLRDPLERAISHYCHYRQQRSDPVHALAMRSSLREWVSDRGLVEMDNGQTRRLAGEMTLPIGAVTEQTLARAKENLLRRFSFVGLTERFEESQVLLHRALGLPYGCYPSLNVAADRLRQVDVDAGALEAVAGRNRFDLELYRFASELLDRAAGAIDMDRQRALLRNAPSLQTKGGSSFSVANALRTAGRASMR